jgi:hypothetical protein
MVLELESERAQKYFLDALVYLSDWCGECYPSCSLEHFEIIILIHIECANMYDAIQSFNLQLRRVTSRSSLAEIMAEIHDCIAGWLAKYWQFLPEESSPVIAREIGTAGRWKYIEIHRNRTISTEMSDFIPLGCQNLLVFSLPLFEMTFSRMGHHIFECCKPGKLDSVV